MVLGDVVGRWDIGGRMCEVEELVDAAGCYRGAVDPRTAQVLATDRIFFSREVASGSFVVVARVVAGIVEWLVAERRPLPGGHWIFLPCAEGMNALTSYDPAVTIVGVVVEIRRRFVEE